MASVTDTAELQPDVSDRWQVFLAKYALVKYSFPTLGNMQQLQHTVDAVAHMENTRLAALKGSDGQTSQPDQVIAVQEATEAAARVAQCDLQGGSGWTETMEQIRILDVETRLEYGKSEEGNLPEQPSRGEPIGARLRPPPPPPSQAVIQPKWAAQS